MKNKKKKKKKKNRKNKNKSKQWRLYTVSQWAHHALLK